MKFTNDSLSRLYSLLGGIGRSEYDPLINTQINSPPVYTQNELITAYRTIWPCRRVCDYLPEQMARGWGKLMLPTNPKMESELNKKMGVLRRLYLSGQKMANLYGGAIIVRLIDDNQPFDNPVGNKVNSISYSRVFNPWEIMPLNKTGMENLEYPEFYYFGGLSDDQIPTKIHSDRVIRFRGSSTDYQTMATNRGFEDSLLIPFLEPCLRYLTALSYVGASVQSFEFLVHKMERLFESIEDPQNQAAIAKRLQLLYNAVSSIRGALIDKTEEDVVVVSRSYGGVSEILELLLNEMVASSGLSKPELLQEHPSGLAATGESERLAQADRIRALQEDKWRESIEFDCALWLQSFSYVKEDWSWQWNNLFQQTPLEDAETKLKLAQAGLLPDDKKDK